MNFLVDAQLPKLLATRLCELGHDACHTLDLAAGNRTPDSMIATMADNTGAVVISKDADFLDSHILGGHPAKLLLISTGISQTDSSCLCLKSTSIALPPVSLKPV